MRTALRRAHGTTRLATVLALAVAAPGATAQLPSNFEAVELGRSRACVEVLARVSALDAQLTPVAERSQRLLAIGQAIAIEERAVIDSLRASDPLEAAVRAWFAADSGMAQRYLATPTVALQDQRSAARDSIGQRVLSELQVQQARADSIIDATGTLQSESGRCTGAVFVRPAVLEVCATTPSPVCDAARDTTTQGGPYRFVDSAEVLWGLQELRAWSAPGPIQPLSTGQLGGARTVGLTRAANIVVTVAFGPLMRRRVDLTPAETARWTAISDSLGFGSQHPDLLFIPSLAVQATLPEALGGETRYMLHFDVPEAADILWVAEADTGEPLEGIIELGPGRLIRLLGNEPLSLTALRPTESGENDPIFSIELTSLYQENATRALAQYMQQQLAADLAELFPPGASAPAPDSTVAPG